LIYCYANCFKQRRHWSQLQKDLEYKFAQHQKNRREHSTNRYRYLVREDLKFPATSFARSKYSTKFTTNNRSACIVDQYPISNQSRSTGRQPTISFYKLSDKYRFRSSTSYSRTSNIFEVHLKTVEVFAKQILILNRLIYQQSMLNILNFAE